MGTTLWQQWIDEHVENLQEALLYNGVVGLLSDFECWLENNGHLNKEEK